MSNTLDFLDKINKSKDLAKPNKKLKESYSDDIKLYMNTWKNYNEYGADLVLYGNIDGWMTPEEAQKFATEHADDEPFINDTDNAPFEISEYDNVDAVVEDLLRYEEADDKEALKAILEDQMDRESAFDIYESGDYTFFPGIDNDEDLGRRYVEDILGGLDSIDNIDYYVDEDAYRESWREAAEESVREDNPDLEEEDYSKFESEVENWLDNVVDKQLEIDAKERPETLEDYFDYESYGSDLGFFYASTGALQTY